MNREEVMNREDVMNREEVVNRKRTLINRCGLLGVISLLSYTSAVIFAPLAYPGYNWMAQAVSDLSAVNAPSLKLWNQLNSLYGVCGIVCCMMACVWIQNKSIKILRVGFYLFTLMNWISQVGFIMFPLSESGYAGTFQDVMHMVVTFFVVVLSIGSLVCIIIGGMKDRNYNMIGKCAGIALILMMAGAILSGVVPAAYFGIVERFSVFSAAGFNAVLGVCLFKNK